MRAQRHVATFTLTITLFTPLVGCTTAAKQAYYTVRGAAGKFYEIKVVDPYTLASYECVRVGQFTNELGPSVPANVIAEVNEQTPQILAESGLFYDQGKLLRITGRIVHFTGKSGLVGSVSSIVGGAEECVCRVQLLDGETGAMIGEAVCWGSVKSVVRRGSGELGIGVGKGVSKWIRKRMPEEVKEARRAELEQG